MSQPLAGGFRWEVAPDAKPPGGFYRGLPIWTNSPEVHQRAVDLLRRYAPPPARVIDIGAGSGALAQHLVDAGYGPVEAVELRAEAFGVKGVRVHALDLNGPFAEEGGLEPAEAAAAVEVIEHLENPWAFARQCARVVKPGGVLVVSTPNIESGRSRVEFLLKGAFRYFDQEAFRAIGHRTALTGRMLRNAFEIAGFEFLERAYDLDRGPRAPTSPRKALRWWLFWLAWPWMKGDRRGEITLIGLRRKA